MPRVIIADDHAIVRAGLRALLNNEPAMELVGEATCGREAIAMTNEQSPDVLILDLSMPDIDGISVTKQVKTSLPDVHVLVLTVHDDDALLRAAISAGASGYILKHAAETELVSAIHRVLDGDMYVDPSMVRSLLADSILPPARPSHTSAPGLSHRETEVLRLIAEGYTNRQIGEKLFISVRTVEGHRASLSAKLGVRSRVEIVRYARDNGIYD